MPKRNYTLPLLIVILLIASAVRFFHIQSQSIWFDEGWSAYAAIQPSLQAAIDSDKTNPPLYYLIVNIAANDFGDSEFSLRWVSLAFGLVAVALAYQLGKQLFNPQSGVMSALLMAFSPLLWWASQEARMYTLLAVLVLLCAITWHKLIPNPPPAKRWHWWLVLWASELALLYAHNTGPVVVLWLNAVTILAWLITAVRSRRQSTVISQQSIVNSHQSPFSNPTLRTFSSVLGTRYSVLGTRYFSCGLVDKLRGDCCGRHISSIASSIYRQPTAPSPARRRCRLMNSAACGKPCGQVHGRWSDMSRYWWRYPASHSFSQSC